MAKQSLVVWSCSPVSLMVEYLPSINGTKRYGQEVLLLMDIFRMFGIPTTDIHLVDEHEIATNVKPVVPGPHRQPFINAMYQGDHHISHLRRSLTTTRYFDPGVVWGERNYVFSKL